ncbi:MAG TPA: PKD domain-containing protein [Pyrinomonadaceae bacterium]
MFTPHSIRRSVSLRVSNTFHSHINSTLLGRRSIALLLICALLLQFLPLFSRVTYARTNLLPGEALRGSTLNRAPYKSALENELSPALTPEPPVAETITDAVISRHKPTLNNGLIDGSLRVLLGESFTITNTISITSDVYLPGAPSVQVNNGAQHGGVVEDGGSSSPNSHTLTLANNANLPGRIHTHSDAVELPVVAGSVPTAAGTRIVTVSSQAQVASIGDWQTVRDLNINGSHITVDMPPGDYGTLTINGNSQVNLSAGTYNFANTFNLDGSARLQATGAVVINVAKDLTINSGALTLGSYTSPADVRLNVLGAKLNIKGSSQVSALISAYNGHARLSGNSQVRGRVIADTVTLNGGKVLGAVWPVMSGSAMTIFGPRRFDRTTGQPNQYVEQFSLPAGTTSPYTLHIQNGSLDGSYRVSSATIKVNGVSILTQSDLNQNVASLDRTITLNAQNQLDISLASDPGSYLIINITGTVPGTDTTAPLLAITSPDNNSTKTETQITVTGTASDSGSGVAHVYVNDVEASYNSSTNTWTLANVSLALGANQITVRAVDQAGNQTTVSITVTREAPENHSPTVDAGADQSITLPSSASLDGNATDDGLPEGSSLTTTWSKVSGPGTVTFADEHAVSTTAAFSTHGTYVLRLTASDTSLTAFDEVTITVEPQNQPPTVNAGVDQTIALPSTATLNGTVTDDALPTGSSLVTTWTKISGPGTVTFEDPALKETVATFSESGTYVLRLTATDSELTSQSEVTITVHPQNQAPTVSAGADQIISLPANADLNGTATDDGWPFGSTLTTSWSMVSGPGTVTFAAPATLTTANFSAPGTYVLRLTASDGELSTTDDLTIVVTPPNQAPTANAGDDQIISLPADTINLNGSAADDGLPLGSTLIVTWTKTSGPGEVTFGNANQATTTAKFTTAGDYILRFTASDGTLSGFDELTVKVTPPNQAPLVSAGNDQTLVFPATASLNGSLSDDDLPLNATVSTTWSKVSGPGTVTFSNANVTVTTASFSEPGTYVLRLTATDTQLTTTDEITIVVDPVNQAPVVNAGTDQAITLPASAALHGTVTDDGYPRGSSVSTSWSKLSGPGTVTFGNASSLDTIASFSVAGTYVLRLTATDTQLTTSDDVQVIVIPQNLAPTVSAGADQTVSLPATASLNGTVVDDGLPFGSTLTTLWTKVSGPGDVTFGDASVTSTTAAFSVPGTYVLRLSANDTELTGSDELTVTVIDPRVPPNANFVVPQSTGVAGGFVISSSGSPGSSFAPDLILDSNPSTSWTTNGPTNQFAQIELYDQQSVYLDRVRIQGHQAGTGTANVKDFEVQVSATTSDDTSFVTVLNATYVNNGLLQEFVFPGGPARARYIRYLPKTNHAGSGTIQTGTFNPVAVGSVDAVVSLPGNVNGALSQSPALYMNGGAIHSFSYGGGSNSANGLLGYLSGGWVTTNTTNQFAIIQLGGSAPATIKGVKLATWFDSGLPLPNGVKNFEIWVSSTTPDAASFTQVLSATLPNVGAVQTVLFPGGPVQARYVKYVPLTTQNGSATTIATPVFDVVTSSGARVVGVSGELQSGANPAEAAFDADANSTWTSPSGVVTNVWVKTALTDEALQKLYGVRILPATNSEGPKDFDIRVSTTTTNDSAFTTVFSGTATTASSSPQEFLFPNPVDAKYVQFFWKNGYSASRIGVREVEALIYPVRGSAIIAFSSQDELASNCIDLDPLNQVWSTANGQTTNQWIKLVMPRGELANINHFALRPAIAANTFYGAPKDFDFQVSTTDSADSSFTTVLSGTFANNTQLQDFYFPTTQARFVRLLLKNNYQFARIGVASFYVYSTDEIGTTTRFLDQSTDSDGPIVSWAWDFGDGGTSTERNPLHTYAQPGNYTVTLTVTDHTGLTHSRQSTYRVVESLRPQFTNSSIIAYEGQQLRFIDFTMLMLQPTAQRRYIFGDGGTLSQFASSSIYTYQDNGLFNASLTVGDVQGLTHSSTNSITVLNFPPVVDIPNGKTVVWGEQWTSVPATITDQGTVDRLTLQGQWNFGDGQTSSCVNCTTANATVTHAYSTPGTYTAVLTITDKDGGAASDSAIYTVNKRATSLTFVENVLQSPGQFRSRAKLTDTFANAGVANRTIQFTINGTNGTATTDASGVAEITLPIATNAIVATIAASFVTDSLYLASSNNASVTLNLAPTVNAGTDQATTFPCGVTLNATATDDGVPSGSSLTASWTKISGSGNVTFANPNALQTSVTFSAAGKYVLRLTVSDSQLTSTDDINVTVNAVDVGSSLYFGPTPYLSFADSPISGRNTTYFYLENFEDHLFNTPGVTASAGGVSSVVFGSTLHDSVDGDDGVIDGSGLAGDSYFTATGSAGIKFTFNATTLGNLPTHAGLVWTDGAGQVFFEAFDRNGVSMGATGPFNFPDLSNNGGTAEDNFLGVYNRDGVSAIKIWNTVGGMEIDHLQYSFSTQNVAPVVNAGADQTTLMGAGSLTLNGAVTDDGLPACVNFSSTWSKVSGPGTVTFGNASTPNTNASFSIAGTYVLRLTASDSLLTTSDDVTVTVNSSASTGTDFWLMFAISPGELSLMISGENATTGNVSVPGISFSQNFAVTPGTVTKVTLPSTALQSLENFIHNKGIHVTAQQPVTVQGLDYRLDSTDGYLGIPVSVLGTEYINLGYKNGTLAGSFFSLVATADGTTVDITPSEDVQTTGSVGPILLKGSTPYRINLNQGQTYLLVGRSATGDLSGSTISANKPIAVFGGHACTNIPSNSVACNHLIEQLPSIDKWGTSFLTVPLATRTGGDTIRVIASRDNTHVSINGSVVATLNRGQLDERILTASSQITADQPVLVAQYSNSLRFDNTGGDPFMAIVPPVEQLLSSYTTATPTTGFASHFVNVVVPNNALSSLLLDGSAVGAGSFSAIGSSGYSGAKLPLSVGSHTITNTSPFGALLYGYKDFDAYGFPAGMALSPLALAGRTTLTPRDAFGLPGNQTCLTATVRDQNNGPVVNTPVAFSVTGANTTTGTVQTNASGLAQFCYTGANPGFDTIVATSTANGSDQAKRYWQPPNQAPITNAGPDQHGPQTVCTRLTIPLQGSATDDGFPIDGPLTYTWTKVSGPGNPNFSNDRAATTTVSFNVAGTYVLRLTTSDTLLSSFDDMQVIVDPAPVNQPPTVSAGSPQTISQGTNLIQNPSNEKPLVNGEIPDWTEVASTTWTQAPAGTNNLPTARGGNTYFYTQSNGPAPTSVLSQDVDLAGLPAGGNITFKAYVRVRPDVPTASANITLEFINKPKNVSLGTITFNQVTTSTTWQLLESTTPIPNGSAWVRVRLNSTGPAGGNGAGLFDALSLRFTSGAAITKLLGNVTDDGLYCGTFTQAWSKVSGPGNVGFSDSTSAITNASFTTPGTYVLRLTGDDAFLTASSTVTITVNAAATNLAPVVNAGGNQTITLPTNSVTLSGTVTDDGLPEGINLQQTWSKVSGPGNVAFATPSSLTTTASFGAAGTYVLRLTGDDSELTASSDVTITVNPEPINQAPVVNAGQSQTIALPDTAALNGTVTDDGLPVGSTLVITWSKVSGPGTVTFGNANSAATTAQFSAVGSYVLRLSATDSAFTVSADVGVIVTPANQAPIAIAGADQTVLLSQSAQLNGSASDDGLPSGNLTTLWSKVSGPGDVTFLNANHSMTGAQFSAIGTYVLRLTASDTALSGSDDITITVIDNVAGPTVEITSPEDGIELTAPTAVTGSVSNGDWVVEYSLNTNDGAANQIWTQFGSGSGAVTNALLGTLDTTLMLNGTFSVRLRSTDEYGQSSFTSISVLVDKNFKLGQLQLAFSDLNVPVAGLPIEVIRSYDSRDKRVGDFGVGWQMGLRNARIEKTGVLGLSWHQTASSGVIPTYCLEPSRPHKVSVTFGDGKVFKFLASTSIHCQQFVPVTSAQLTFTPQPGTHATLEVVGPNDILVETLGSIPGPVRLLNQNNPDIFNSFTFRLTTAEGISYVIDQQTGVSSIRDPYGNTLTINAGGVIHSSGKSIAFERDTLGRITKITDPNGNFQTYEYDNNGDLVKFTDRENNATTFTYNSDHHLLTMVDARGVNMLTNEYDAAGRLIGQKDAFNKTLAFDHNIAGRVETITDRLGRETRYEFDERGNVLRQVDARGGIKTFTYDDLDNVLTETNQLNKTTTYTYDAADNRTSITDPLNHVTHFTYNGARQVLTVTDARNKLTTNTYDPAGTNMLTTTDPLNHTTTFTYSLFTGQRTTAKDALNHVTHYDYDAAGRLSSETNALGHVTTYGYDQNGNLTTQTVTRTNAQGQPETITTTFTYDKLNRLTKTTFADGSFTRVEYNAIGQKSATIDQLNHRTEFTYDDMARVTRTDYPDGTHEEATYDAEGHRLTSKDRAGRVTTFEYDELGRLIKTTYSDNTFTSTSYDAAGQVLTTTDARGNITRHFYDDAGRRTKVRNALNQETTFTYDANGNQLTMTDALQHTTTQEYDDRNQRVKTLYHDSSFDTAVYDALGRNVSKTDQGGKTTQFFYDELGRLAKVKDALNQETTYSYNELGQQLTQTDANSHTMRFEYDQLGRRVKRMLPAGQFETYSYDTGGSLASRTDFNGKTTTFTYDVMRRLLTKTPDASLNQPSVSFTYNANGQRATMTDAAGQTVYTYDGRNRLESKQTPFGTLSYTYDDGGNLLTTRSSNTNGVSVDYSYDVLNRLSTTKDNRLLALNGGVTSYNYDDVGNLESYLYPNGVKSSYSYNTLNRLTSMGTTAGATALSNYNYTLGPSGNRTAVTELSGRTVTYTYDDLYRVTSETINNDTHSVNGAVSYNLDAVGNRLSRTSTVIGVPSQASTFDQNDRLNSDTYDANGNTTASNTNSYAYDFENQLTSLNNGAVTYVYDGDGNRVSKTVSGVTTNYLVDTNNHTGYAQVVEELQNNAVVKQFTYGHDLISQRVIGGPLSFYSYDGHGSVRQLTDASASITDTYDYDAFGNLISRTGTTPNDYLYSGEQFDANVGFYYLRARYMDPSGGRFWSMDLMEGAPDSPVSLHKYLYANDNPVDWSDPSGLYTLSEATTTSAEYGRFQASYTQAQLIPTTARLPLVLAKAGTVATVVAPRALALGFSLALGIGTKLAIDLLKKEFEKEYEFVTVYRWTNELAPAGFRIKPRDRDGYLSVFRDLPSPRAGDYNVPMLAVFRKPITETESGDLIVPAVIGVKVWWSILEGDPNGHLHFSLDYPGGMENQGSIPDEMSAYAKKLNLKPNEFRTPF